MGLVKLALGNVYGVIVFALFLMVLGSVAIVSIPVDILPAFKAPAVQVLTYYNGMPARSIEKTITNRIERWVNQSPGVGQRRVAVGPGRQRRQALLPRRHRPERGPDDDQLARPGHAADPAAQHPAAGRPAVRPDRHAAAGHPHRQQPDDWTRPQVKDLARIEVRNMLGACPRRRSPRSSSAARTAPS